MSDPNLEEESLISQDDIDKLLDSSSIEEAEKKLESANDSSPDLDEVGELSQDDIDRLMGGSDFAPASGEADDEDEVGELSQDDIDNLMGGNDPVAQEDAAGELSQDDIDNLMGGGSDEDEDEDEMGELSQDDIDSLMGGNDPAAQEDATEDISQDDIDSPMNRDVDVGEEISLDDLGDEDDVDELISMDDIQNLIGENEENPVDSGGKTEDSVASPPLPADAAAVSDDYVIDASEALEVSQCLITQETLDELIQNAPVPLDTEAITPEPVVLDGDDLDMDVSDEFESLLDTDDITSDTGRPDSDDVTQEDIDALLQETDEDEDEDLLGDDEDILISQDDIDTLLMAADQEDEDVLGDLMGDDMDISLDDDFEDDFEDEDVPDTDGEEEGSLGEDRVVLEGGDDFGTDESGSSSSGKRWKKWYKSKLAIAAASALLVLGISVPSVYFLFFSHDPVQLPEKMPVPIALEQTGREVEVANVDIDTKAMPDLKKSGNIILTDFVVLTSDLSKDMAYVTVDISIDYSDQRAYHEINDNITFYRDLIYDSIQKNLVWEKRNEVTEADLILGVETTLKKILPPQYIEKVSFKSFRAS